MLQHGGSITRVAHRKQGSSYVNRACNTMKHSKAWPYIQYITYYIALFSMDHMTLLIPVSQINSHGMACHMEYNDEYSMPTATDRRYTWFSVLVTCFYNTTLWEHEGQVAF